MITKELGAVLSGYFGKKIAENEIGQALGLMEADGKTGRSTYNDWRTTGKDRSQKSLFKVAQWFDGKEDHAGLPVNGLELYAYLMQEFGYVDEEAGPDFPDASSERGARGWSRKRRSGSPIMRPRP